MMRFEYKAATIDGDVTGGVIVGRNRAHIVEQLRALGKIPIRINEAKPAKSERPGSLIRPTGKISEQRVADMTRELATLLRAGMPLDRALRILAALAGDQPLGAVLEDIREHVKQGDALADAIDNHAAIFGRFYSNLIRAGEVGGALESVLEGLANHLDRSIEIRDSLKSALIYPAVLVVVAVLSIFILLGHVVPQFTEMFESVGEALPLSTRVTIGVGEFLKSWGWLIVVATAAAYLLLRRQFRDPHQELRWHRRLLRLPIAGKLTLKIEIARFARTLATLLQNGIPLLKALRIVSDTMSNRALAGSIDQAAAGLTEGRNLSEQLAETGVFPPFAVHMIKVGEESGDLVRILLQVASTYDRDTQVTLKRSMALLEPVLILVLGAIIAAVIISILVAILGVNELVI